MTNATEPGQRIETLAELLALPNRTILELPGGWVAHLDGEVKADRRGAYMTNMDGLRGIGEGHLPATVLKLGDEPVEAVRPGPPPNQILDLTMDVEEGTLTIRERLVGLLSIVWADPMGFDGKRPWGFSTWRWDFYNPMIKAGFMAEDERARGEQLIAEAIKALASEGAR